MRKKIYAVSLGNIFQLQGLPLSPVNHSRSLHTPMDHSTLALFHKTGLFKKHAWMQSQHILVFVFVGALVPM